jgi:hypothetical protein
MHPSRRIEHQFIRRASSEKGPLSERASTQTFDFPVVGTIRGSAKASQFASILDKSAVFAPPGWRLLAFNQPYGKLKISW